MNVPLLEAATQRTVSQLARLLAQVMGRSATPRAGPLVRVGDWGQIFLANLPRTRHLGHTPVRNGGLSEPIQVDAMDDHKRCLRKLSSMEQNLIASQDDRLTERSCYTHSGRHFLPPLFSQPPAQ
jgi:hypothetical protein